MTYVSSTYLLTLPKVFAVVTSSVLAVLPRALGRRFVYILVAFGVFAALLATDVRADPAADALAELTELSRLAEQTTEQIHTAQIDLDEKLAAQQVAEKGADSDRMTADAAAADLVRYQAAVDRLAAAAYVGAHGYLGGGVDGDVSSGFDRSAGSPEDGCVGADCADGCVPVGQCAGRGNCGAVCEVGSPSTDCGR